MGRNAVVDIAQHDLLDLGTVGQHGDDHVATFADLSLARTPGAGGLQLLDGSLAAVVDQQIRISSLEQIFCHGLAHDAETNKTNFHREILLPDQ